MSGFVVAFFLLSLSAILGGVMMLNSTKVMHMMLSLVLTFISIAGIYVLLSAEFVAVVQILIYSGAVTILMIFGIMLTKHDIESEKPKRNWRNIAALIGIVAFGVVMFLGVNGLSIDASDVDLATNNTKNIGLQLFTNHIVPFEVMSVLLLIALVGAIILAKSDDSKEEGTKE
ncbi:MULTISPECIES: NADH-quinone oxidoreductase subunit J [Bacillaceae]|uniref:NADH-quinone oxidoreductase subunit J n=1 Tax=Bacillaceae TaxID=186817 RepID=UPI000400FB40|nr:MULTISPECIES: NADH-quinone oxidoreductase subunit J [unclassified Bacillus (in: firmicutes)]PEC50474.1 NADH:ubiquinone oxidoreductase subunit J [Bacillus sp. AFS096315]PFH91931.1 NADH:ubiquinone oxidoreductase subunit J [Bacillus sp. AFS088145]PFM81994.1 NADH:ubiquinone oxidoreductase subunit J [Bacillus sp. AFS077874]PGM59156.1 NADH:ubiquinone oxidoreductase subunit J [Bacillus sp. AFS053548]